VTEIQLALDDVKVGFTGDGINKRDNKLPGNKDANGLQE
jgi:hypothetical protein